MEETLAVPVVPKSDIGEHEPIQPVASPLLGRIFTFVVGLVAVAAIACVAWVYAETQREIVRMSTDIAQIRVSLELYGRQQTGGGTAPAGDQLQDLSNRLAILEQSWRSQPPAAAPAQLPDLPAAGAETANCADADCMPQGTRFLVSGGDIYPICGTTGVVQITSVDANIVNFTDGTMIPAGGNAILKGTKCTVAVSPSSPEGLSGYAELRVSCS